MTTSMKKTVFEIAGIAAAVTLAIAIGATGASMANSSHDSNSSQSSNFGMSRSTMSSATTSELSATSLHSVNNATDNIANGATVGTVSKESPVVVAPGWATCRTETRWPRVTIWPLRSLRATRSPLRSAPPVTAPVTAPVGGASVPWPARARRFGAGSAAPSPAPRCPWNSSTCRFLLLRARRRTESGMSMARGPARRGYLSPVDIIRSLPLGPEIPDRTPGEFS